MKVNLEQNHYYEQRGGSDLREQLSSYIDLMDDAIRQGKQLPKDTAAANDIALMDDFIAIANQKKEGLNAHFFRSPLDMVNYVKSLIPSEDTTARFVVNMGSGSIHCIAVDCAIKNGKCSLIGIEPVTMNSLGASMLAIRLQSVCKRELPETSLVIMETDMQRSQGECLMFSLFLVKKMHKECDEFQYLHDKNINRELPLTQGLIVSVKDADSLLPPSLMKHTQSPNRLQKYLEMRPEAMNCVVNKKGETLKTRQQRHITTIELGEKTVSYSNSIEQKRIKEAKGLLNNL
ncbi:TPA: type III secretion system YopJ family effector VopA [Vibrio parahaemolyticus]|uniref:type III secretion system YopJ family effector VopA n=1 Tax=Vibrio parahaemolyticus TaxID=670 RepID=UPI0003FAC94B|nr:type III secretion system YopJ family effector VopA [Vibrio parahaemolyticus]